MNSKWIKDLNISHDTIKVLEENTGSKILDISHSNIFANVSPRPRKKDQRKNKQMGLYQIKKLLHSQRNPHQNKKGTNYMGEHICQQHIGQVFNLQYI